MPESDETREHSLAVVVGGCSEWASAAYREMSHSDGVKSRKLCTMRMRQLSHLNTRKSRPPCGTIYCRRESGAAPDKLCGKVNRTSVGFYWLAPRKTYPLSSCHLESITSERKSLHNIASSHPSHSPVPR